MSVLLRIIDGPQAGASYELREGHRAVLGRGDRSDFHILDSWASRLHCAITYRPDGLIVEDLNTKNGTFVNGKQVDKARLPDGSLLQLGTTTVQVLVQPTRRTVVAAAALPLRGRAVRVAATLAAAAVLLGGAAIAAFLVFGPRGHARPQGGHGVTWESPKSPRGWGLFGSASRGSVDITTEPPGATVFVDDEFRGQTPLPNLEVAAGEHSLRIQKAGYEVHRAPLSIGGRAPGPVHVVLKPAQRGSLSVTSKPDGASVHLDGEYKGKTPLTIEELEPGTYTLRLVKENFADWERTVTVATRECAMVDATLGRREVAYYEAELKKDPNNVSYHTEVAHLYLLEQKVEACMAHLAQAIEITSADRDTSRPGPYAARLQQMLAKIYNDDHFRYGDAAFVAKVQAAVDAMLAELAGRLPDSSFIHATAQTLYKRAGTSLREKAAAYQRKAKAQPTELSHYLTAAGFLLLAHEQASAEAVLRSACEANAADHRPYVALGRFYLGWKRRGVSGGREKAVQALNAALQRCKDEAAKEEIRRLLGDSTN